MDIVFHSASSSNVNTVTNTVQRRADKEPSSSDDDYDVPQQIGYRGLPLPNIQVLPKATSKVKLVSRTDVQRARYQRGHDSDIEHTHQMADQEDLVDLVAVGGFGPKTALGSKTVVQDDPPDHGGQDSARSKSERVRRYRVRAVHSEGPGDWAEPRSKAMPKHRT